MDEDERLTWHNKAALYELLSLFFLPAKKEVAQALSTGEFASACEEILFANGFSETSVRDITASFSLYAGRDPEDVFHDVRREYTRLFVGGGKPPITPYLGVWRSMKNGEHPLLFVGKESMRIERFMVERGVVAGGESNDPVDHVGSVLEFLEYLCLVNAGSVQAPEGAVAERGDHEAFFEAHFRNYAGYVVESIGRESENPGYRAAADILEELLRRA